MTEPLPDDPASAEEDPDEFTPQDALAVDATPDEERTHGDGDETESITRSDAAKVPVEPEDE